MVKDPVCGMMMDEKEATATAEYKNKSYYFCSSHCKMSFDKEPEKYIGEEKHGQHYHH
ncbi:MAG: YHS domain-containing protein [Calditrichaeota bacterium]|nr:YHS domain-containing protein [Calditrichota bacterium]